MTAFRAVHGIDFDGVGDAPAIRVEPGEALPPIADAQADLLLALGAIAVDDSPAAPVKKGRK